MIRLALIVIGVAALSVAATILLIGESATDNPVTDDDEIATIINDSEPLDMALSDQAQFRPADTIEPPEAPSRKPIVRTISPDRFAAPFVADPTELERLDARVCRDRGRTGDQVVNCSRQRIVIARFTLMAGLIVKFRWRITILYGKHLGPCG